MMVDIEDFLTKPYWIIDILPKQVPADASGQYFAIEKYFLSSPQVDDIYHKFAGMILSLNCYHDILVLDGNKCIVNPEPFTLEQMVQERKPLNIVINRNQAMISITGDDHYMTLYGPDNDLLGLISLMASTQGLHVWNTQNNKYNV